MNERFAPGDTSIAIHLSQLAIRIDFVATSSSSENSIMLLKHRRHNYLPRFIPKLLKSQC